ncbi:hypothetical protein DFH06DRAFT_1152095 [Mycena polygramma]|nr:hypothetical protein DFH06DRAFT_1152095 [Mycena polygramma]
MTLIFRRDTVCRIAKLAHKIFAVFGEEVLAKGISTASLKNPSIQILLAQNDELSPSVKAHLEKQLKVIHNHRPQLNGFRKVPLYIPSKSDSDYHCALAALETQILTYSWARIRHRFSKNGRHQNVVETAQEICGVFTSQREDLNEKERGQLDRLQSFPAIDYTMLQQFAKDTEILGRVLLHSANEERVNDARILLHMPYRAKSALESQKAFVRSWDCYIQDVKIVAIPNTPPTPHTTKLDCETMERILLAADCEIAEMSIEELLQLLAQTHPDTSPSTKDEYPIPYVGLSKRSCAFCATYFAAYRAATNTTICMRSSHGRTADWTCPTLDDPEVEAEVRNGVASGLLKLTGTAWNDYRHCLCGPRSGVARDETLGEGVVEEHDRILKKWA